MTKRKFKADREKIERSVEMMLDGMGFDLSDSSIADTPDRVARAMLEMTRGYEQQASRILSAEFDDPYDEIVLLRDIPFYSMCVPSNQHVNAVEGSKRAAKVQVGDKLWTLHEGRAVQTTVTHIDSHKTHNVVEVVTDKGTFRVTADHPLATPNGWVEAQHAEGQMVEWTAARSLCRRRFEPVMGYDLGYVIGAVTSDGSVGDRAISLVVNDRQFAEKFSKTLELALGVESEIESVTRPSGFAGKDTSGFRVRVVSSYLADLFRMWVGGDAHHMRQQFPRVVLHSEQMMQGFIDGYVDGDGHRAETATGSIITSGNVEFLKEFAEVIDASFTPREGTSQLYVSDRWAKPGWYNKHGFRQEDHRTDLIESQWVKVHHVRLVEGGTKPTTVYSFTCDPYPTFLIQGHLTHNCEHHLLPFFGRAAVAYIPSSKVVGLSKLARLVEMHARRLQLQERMTRSIADDVMTHLEPRGVGVVVAGQHFCMCARGVEKPGAEMVTSAMLGFFREQPEARAELMSLVSG